MVDARHMRRALELAARYHTHPNPRVGAVLVGASGEVIAEGAHEGAGQPHAEVVALRKAGKRAAASTLYVTLEPCSHQGLTPPCVEAILASGITGVVVAVMDPDPRVSGTGIARLERGGVDVEFGLLSEEARDLDPGYFRHRETGMPRVILKMAMTLDGSVAALDRTSRWITSEPAREDAHRLRASVDAVAVGAQTLRDDDPELSVRLEGESHQPRPVVLAGGEALPGEARIWSRDPIVISTVDRPLPAGQLLVVDGDDGHPDPAGAARALADQGIYDILLEGGPTVAGAWWRAGVVTEGVVYLAGKLGGGTGVGPLGGEFVTLSDARRVTITKAMRVGEDLRIEFE